MSDLVTWAGQYSAPVVALLALGAGLVFVVRNVVQKAIEAEFENRHKRVELLLARRANFEEKILIEQYDAVAALQMKLGDIAADIRRTRSGIAVEGFMNGTEIVPLTEVYIELQARRFLLRESFHDLLKREADALLAFGRATDPARMESLQREFLMLNEQLRGEMNRAFGLEDITWARLRLE